MRPFKIVFLVALLALVANTAYGFNYLQGAVTANGLPYTKYGTVYLSCNNGSTWASDWATINSSGNYVLDDDYWSPCGSYYSSTSFTTCSVFAYPYWNDSDNTITTSDYYPVTLDCDSTTTQDIALNIKDKTIDLTITAGGNPVTSGIIVSCGQQESPWVYSTTSTGSVEGVYSLPVIAGRYNCYAYCSVGSSCNFGGNPSTYVTVSESDTTKTASLAFTVKDKTIALTVKAGSTPITSGITASCSQQESPWLYDSTSTNTDGVYNLRVSTGTFYCYAYCSDWNSCSYSGYPSTRVTVASGDTTVAANLAFTVKDKVLRVTLATTSGATLTSGMTVYASEQGGGWSYSSVNYASGGTYQMAVGEAKYYVSAYCTNWNSCSVSGYPNATVTMEASDSTVDVTLTFLQNDSTISGAVTNGGSGVANANVSVYSYKVSSSGAGSAWNISKSAGRNVGKAVITGGTSSTTMVSSWAQTDSSGAFQVTLPAGTYTVSASPPWTSTTLGQASVEITTTANTTTAVSIALPSKTAQISGTVKDADGNGLANVSISGWSYGGQTGTSDWFWTQSDSNGAFSVYGVDGLKYNVSAYFWSNSAANTVCNYNNEGMQSVLASAATPQTINFTYPTCDCTVTLNAVDSGGTVISSIYGGVNAAPTTIATGEFWYGIWGSISGGTGTMKVQSDVEYTFSPYVWDSSYVQGDDVKGTCSNGAASVNLSMLALDATISGSYLDDAGSALSTDNYSYISVYSTKDRAYRSCTTSSDSYTCAVSSGRWCLGYWIDPSSGFASSSAGASTNCIDITSGSSTTRNLTLLRTGSISVSVLGADGNAKQNVWVEAAPYSNADRGANDYQYMYMSSGCMTDSSGACTINVGASSAGVVYYLNAYIPYYMKSSENLLNPQEVSVTVTAGATVTASALTFEKPDGTSVITVTQAAAATSLSFGKSASKSLINPDTSTSSSPAIGATVDCFSTSGGSFEAETDNNGVATCPCMTVDTWKAVAHNKVSNNLWMSEASDITCTVEGGAGSAAMSNVAILPEGKSVSVSDASSMSLTLELSDGFSVYFPNGSLSNSAESVTCKADTTVTPFTANRRPASFYGYVVECQKDSTGASIVQLNSNATFTVPINQTQVENLGLSMTDVEMTYFSDSIGAYSVVDNGYTTDSTRLLITYQQNHMTSFTVVGNGNLAGVAGGEAGDGGNEYAADAAGSSGCGCKVGARPADGDWIWGPLLIFVTAGLLWVAKRRGKCRGGL